MGRAYALSPEGWHKARAHLRLSCFFSDSCPCYEAEDRLIDAMALGPWNPACLKAWTFPWLGPITPLGLRYPRKLTNYFSEKKNLKQLTVLSMLWVTLTAKGLKFLLSLVILVLLGTCLHREVLHAKPANHLSFHLLEDLKHFERGNVSSVSTQPHLWKGLA